MIVTLATTATLTPHWMAYLALAVTLANSIAIIITVVYLAKGHRFQVQQHEELVEIRKPRFYWHEGQDVFEVEIVNTGDREVFIRTVKLHVIGGANLVIPLGSSDEATALVSGDSRCYGHTDWRISTLESCRGHVLLVTVESNQETIASDTVYANELIIDYFDKAS